MSITRSATTVITALIDACPNIQGEPFETNHFRRRLGLHAADNLSE
jgi:hypothetical protein